MLLIITWVYSINSQNIWTRVACNICSEEHFFLKEITTDAFFGKIRYDKNMLEAMNIR